MFIKRPFYRPLFLSWVDNSEESEETENTAPHNTPSPLAIHKSDPGRIGLDSLISEAAKLKQLRQLELPANLFGGISNKVLQIYKQRVAVEPPRELRRHPDSRRYTLLSAFCWLRTQKITDKLVELLIQIIHRINSRAERRVSKELLDDFKKVSGKTGILFQLEYFYERSIGCVGILKDWLTQAYRQALDESASTLSEHHWQSYAPSLLQCLQIAAEAIEGEKAFQFESGEMSLLRQKLGLSGASSSTISSENLSVSAASSKKTKGRPGVRQPNRDVIGEP